VFFGELIGDDGEPYLERLARLLHVKVNMEMDGHFTCLSRGYLRLNAVIVVEWFAGRPAGFEPGPRRVWQ
jgi:hypothetical protein